MKTRIYAAPAVKGLSKQLLLFALAQHIDIYTIYVFWQTADRGEELPGSHAPVL